MTEVMKAGRFGGIDKSWRGKVLKGGSQSRRLASAPPPAHIRTRPIRRLTRQPSAVPTLAARSTRPAASLGFGVTRVEKRPPSQPLPHRS